MECINCGGSINGAIAGQVINCEYCGTSCALLPVANASSLGTSENHNLSPEIDKLLKIVQIDIESKEYESATKHLNKIIELDSVCWQGYANLAITTFWLGRADFKHLENVVQLISKAALFSNNSDYIASIGRAISFNLAQLVCVKNPVGVQLERSIYAIEVSKKLVPNFSERDAVVNEFALKQAQAISNRLLELLKRDKKEIDPPKSELLIMGRLLIHSSAPASEHLKNYIAFTSYKIQKKGDVELSNLIEKIVPLYSNISGVEKTPQLHFPFFGSPQVV